MSNMQEKKSTHVHVLFFQGKVVLLVWNDDVTWMMCDYTRLQDLHLQSRERGISIHTTWESDTFKRHPYDCIIAYNLLDVKSTI